MVKKIITLFIICLVLPAVTLAARFTATVNQNQITVGQSFELKLTLSGASAKSNPEISALKNNFTIHGRGQSSNTTIINGHISSNTSWSYTLIPKNTGNISIPVLAINSSEGQLQTQAISVSIGKASSLPASDENNGIVISARVSKRNPYKNEPITYTVTLISRYDLANVSLSEMTLENAVVEQNGKPEIYDSTQNGLAVKVIKASYIITPLKAGKITIPASTIQGGIPIKSKRRRTSSFFGRSDPFGMMKDFDDLLGRTELKPFAVASKPITLQVAPPVAGVNPWLPASYLGITENWDAAQALKVGEPISRRFTITASGVSSSQLPSLEAQQGKDLKVYADQPELDEAIEDGTIISSRKESYTLIPDQSGRVTLPKISIAWWDVNKKKIAYATIPERELTIAPGEPGSGFTPPAQAQHATAPSTQNAPANSVPQIDIPATQVAKQDNRLFYAVIAGLIVILLFIIFWVISLKKKVAQLAEVRTNDPSDNISKKKPLKPIPAINSKEFDTIKTVSELQKYLQNYAYEHWGVPKNTPLEEIFKQVKQRSPALDSDIEQVLKPLVAALYADREVDLNKLKKHCAVIIQSMQKKPKSSKEKTQNLPELNPS